MSNALRELLRPPKIFINGTHVGGSDELFELDVRGELDKLLGRTPPAI